MPNWSEIKSRKEKAKANRLHNSAIIALYLQEIPQEHWHKELHIPKKTLERYLQNPTSGTLQLIIYDWFYEKPHRKVPRHLQNLPAFIKRTPKSRDKSKSGTDTPLTQNKGQIAPTNKEPQ